MEKVHRSLTFKWNGAHTVNVFYEGREVECFTIGSFEANAATEQEFLESIDDWASTVWDNALNYNFTDLISRPVA